MPSCCMGSCCHRRKESKAMKQKRRHRSGCSKCLIANEHPSQSKSVSLLPPPHSTTRYKATARGTGAGKGRKHFIWGIGGQQSLTPNTDPQTARQRGGRKGGPGAAVSPYLREVMAPHGSAPTAALPPHPAGGSPASGETPPSDIPLATPPLLATPFSHARTLIAPPFDHAP